MAGWLSVAQRRPSDGDGRSVAVAARLATPQSCDHGGSGAADTWTTQAVHLGHLSQEDKAAGGRTRCLPGRACGVST